MGPWERLLDEMLPYYAFARRFHWTPAQVDAESLLAMRALLTISDAADEIQASARERQAVMIRSQMGR